MTKMKDAKILGQKLLVDSFKKVVSETVQFSEHDVQDWIYVDTPKSIVIVAYTPANEVVLVKLYRHNLRQDCIELPAGTAEHDNETTLKAAREAGIQGVESLHGLMLAREYIQEHSLDILGRIDAKESLPVITVHKSSYDHAEY